VLARAVICAKYPSQDWDWRSEPAMKYYLHLAVKATVERDILKEIAR